MTPTADRTTTVNGEAEGIIGMFGSGFGLVVGVFVVIAFVLIAFAAGAQMGQRKE